MPRDLSTFRLPPHGVLTRVEYARADGSYWLRSAATRLRQMMDDALLALPVGRRHRDADGASIWTAAFSSRHGLAGGVARLGAWGRPTIAALEFEGPFRPDLGPVTISLTPKPTAEPILDVFALLSEASR